MKNYFLVKQKCKEFLGFSTQSFPEVRFLIDSSSCSNKMSLKYQYRTLYGMPLSPGNCS